MKRTILTFVLGMAFYAANAISLFPHFVDVAGDYNDGTTPKFEELSIPVKCSKIAPYFYKTIKEADDFLMDTLPTSSYVIEKEEKTLPDGTQIIIYTTSLEADGLYKDKWSKLYLVQSPDELLNVGLVEDTIN